MRFTYKVLSDQPSKVKPTLEPQYCTKVSETGELRYEINSDLILTIYNDSARTRQNAAGAKKGTHLANINLEAIIPNLKVGKTYENPHEVITNEMLGATSKNNSAFICAILKDLGFLEIKRG